MRKAFIEYSLEKELYDLNIHNKIKRNTLVEIHISDIHFGAMDPKYQYQILCEQMINKLEYVNFDIISLDGDLFDHKFMSNSNVIMYASMFIDKLVSLCRNKNATLVIIHGTYFHDADQLKLFYHYLEDTSVDIRIIENVRFEYIKGAKILCIPELYGKDESYYDNFLKYSGTYDSVFMHGTIKGSIYGTNNSGMGKDKSPIFDIEDFSNCRGPIISGHVHTSGCFYGYFYYNGSPYRWKFGEEEDKGFLIVLHNLDTHEHYVELQPIKCFRYDTINLDHMLMSDPKEVIDYITRLQNNGIDYIRVEFDNVNQNTIPNINIIKKFYRNNQRIKIEADLKNDRYIKEDKEVMDKYTGYDFILDKSLSEYDILTQYINKQKGYEYLTVDELKSILEEEI